MPDLPTSTGGYILAGIVGIIWVVREIRMSKNLVSDEKDQAEQSLITTQKELLEALEKKVENLEIEIKEQKRQQDINVQEIQVLKSDNEKFIKIFQGRDGATQDFQKAGTEAFINIKTIVDSIKAQNTNIEKLYGIIQELIKKINPI